MILEEFAMLPETVARRALADHPLALRVLRPPYPALGLGVLRVLRIKETPGERLEITAGYDGYEKIG